MDTNQKREEVKKAYPSSGWAEKVNKMSDEQIVAIYFRLKAEGKI